MFRFQAKLIGRGAKEHLDGHGDATVCAVFRRSFYLESAGGELTCIGPMAIGAGPLNVICDLPDGIDWDASGVRPGARIIITSNRFSIAGLYEFEFGGAPGTASDSAEETGLDETPNPDEFEIVYAAFEPGEGQWAQELHAVRTDGTGTRELAKLDAQTRALQFLAVTSAVVVVLAELGMGDELKATFADLDGSRVDTIDAGVRNSDAIPFDRVGPWATVVRYS